MEIQVIKAKQQERKRTKVAVYARVSSDEAEPEKSLQNQITHYEEVISQNPEYDLIEIYYDFGISGFKEKRPGFQKMMEDARAHRFELIITKSITRFARNTGTVLNATRELKGLGIGVFFELQNINTLTQAGELLMTVFAAFGQGESDEASKLARMTYKRKFDAGEPVQYLHHSFGYRKAEDGTFLPDDNAKWVRKMYQLAIDGYSYADIARCLNGENVPTEKGNVWNSSKVMSIIKNVIYKGDFIMQKYYVDENRKSRRNYGERKKLYIENDHEPLVSHEIWEKAQQAMERKSEYKASGAGVKELTEENYPYKDLIFCGKCGMPLRPRIYSNGNRLCWQCSGKRRFPHDNFCEGINVPDQVIREWDPQEAVYITMEKDALGRKSFRYKTMNQFKDGKVPQKMVPALPAFTTENYPFKDHVFCKYCGSKLGRRRWTNSTVWICTGYETHGKNFCKGIGFLPDAKMQKLGKLDHDIYIGKEIIDGKESYGYSSKPDEVRHWRKAEHQ